MLLTYLHLFLYSFAPQGCLPLVLMFDIKEDIEVEPQCITALMEQLDVFISIKPKPKQPSKVCHQAYTRTACRALQGIYPCWRHGFKDGSVRLRLSILTHLHDDWMDCNKVGDDLVFFCLHNHKFQICGFKTNVICWTKAVVFPL